MRLTSTFDPHNPENKVKMRCLYDIWSITEEIKLIEQWLEDNPIHHFYEYSAERIRIYDRLYALQDAACRPNRRLKTRLPTRMMEAQQMRED